MGFGCVMPRVVGASGVADGIIPLILHFLLFAPLTVLL